MKMVTLHKGKGRISVPADNAQYLIDKGWSDKAPAKTKAAKGEETE